MCRQTPACWYKTVPKLLEKGAAKKLIAMAKQANAALMKRHGLPLGLIFIDTITACAGYPTAGAEYDSDRAGHHERVEGSLTGAQLLRVRGASFWQGSGCRCPRHHRVRGRQRRASRLSRRAIAQ